jgi:ABC-type multidrug transport system fused ATPase/permease subunit
LKLFTEENVRVGRILGIVLVIAGALFLYFSHYINTQVAEGRSEISSGQTQVDTITNLFSVNPVSKEVGKQFTGSAQSRINEGTIEANQYAEYANWFMIGGIITIVAGAVVFLLMKKRT